jgi:putative transposase
MVLGPVGGLVGSGVGGFTWLRRLRVDGGYTGESFAQWVKGHRPKLVVEVGKRFDATVGFKGLPRRWVGERTFGWRMRHRRLVRDSENTETSAATWIFIARIRSQFRRLAEFLSKNEFSDLLLETLQLK